MCTLINSDTSVKKRWELKTLERGGIKVELEGEMVGETCIQGVKNTSFQELVANKVLSKAWLKHVIVRGILPTIDTFVLCQSILHAGTIGKVMLGIEAWMFELLRTLKP